MTMLYCLLLGAAIAIPACVAEGRDWDLWRECANSTGHVFSDEHPDVTEEDCLMLPRWQSAGCTENVVRNFCVDEPEASYDDCLHQRTNQLCCYRFTLCERYNSDGMNCSHYEASGNDLDSCLDDNKAVKDACVNDCRAQFPVGAERGACKDVCREARFAANKVCKACHRCDTAQYFCLKEEGSTTPQPM